MRLVALLLALLCSGAVSAQTPVLGSSHDPLEAPLDPFRRQAARLAAFGGPSYIGVTWRLGTGIEAEGSAGPFSVKLSGRLRAGVDGLYEPDINEVYDLLRLLEFARLQPDPDLPVYLRIGPVRRLTLGSGLLVRDLSSTAAWDERTVGVETAITMGALELGGFSADVRPDNLVGGYARTRFRPTGPHGWVPELMVHAVHDLGIDLDDGVSAGAAEVRLGIPVFADLMFTPFIAHARYLNFGHGTTMGASFGADDVAGIGLFRASAGITASSERFIPGHLNAFYPVKRPGRRIVDSDAFFRNRDTDRFAGTALDEADGGTSLFLELQAIVFGSFELTQHVRRDYGGRTGAYGIRMAFSPERGRDFRFLFDLQRQGLDGFRDLFSDLVDEAALTFQLDYTFSSPFRAFIRSRYGYRPVDPLPDGTGRYLVERRFEPMVGIFLYR